jgi:hypothetical protein
MILGIYATPGTIAGLVGGEDSVVSEVLNIESFGVGTADQETALNKITAGIRGHSIWGQDGRPSFRWLV